MEITFGVHNGKSVEEVFLKEPQWMHWLFGQKAVSGKLQLVKKHAEKLASIFDTKAVLKPCKGCGQTATRCTVYQDNLVPVWWCDSCDEYMLGANNGKLQSVRTYRQAGIHVEFYCRNRKSDHQELIRSIAEAKGLPKRIGALQCEKFFAA